MNDDDLCDLIMMVVAARGMITILETSGSNSCKPGMQAFNEMSVGMSWLCEQLEAMAHKLAQEV